MVGVAQVLGVELPVVVDDLALNAERLHLPGHVAADEVGLGLAEITLHRRRLLGERAEDHVAEDFHPKRLQAVLLQVEIFRHAALAADAVLEGEADELAVEPVVPGMVDAGQRLGVALVLQADERALGAGLFIIRDNSVPAG